MLILSEIYYRGWEAWIDGKREPVERVNYTLRGVMLPAGEHRVEFVFLAPSFRTGAVYSLLGVILLLGGLVISRTSGGKRILESASRAASRAPRLSRRQVLTIIGILCLLIYCWVLIKHAARAVGGSDSSSSRARDRCRASVGEGRGTQSHGVVQSAWHERRRDACSRSPRARFRRADSG